MDQIQVDINAEEQRLVTDMFAATNTEEQLPDTNTDDSFELRDNTEDIRDADFEEISVSRPPTQTPHTNPNWLRNLKTNYNSDVVDKCSQRTRQAIEMNEDIKVT